MSTSLKIKVKKKSTALKPWNLTFLADWRVRGDGYFEVIVSCQWLRVKNIWVSQEGFMFTLHHLLMGWRHTIIFYHHPHPPPPPPQRWQILGKAESPKESQQVQVFFQRCWQKNEPFKFWRRRGGKQWARLPMNPLHQYAHSYLVVCCGSCLTKCVETNYLNTDFRDEYKEGLYRSKEMYSFQSKRM